MMVHVLMGSSAIPAVHHVSVGKANVSIEVMSLDKRVIERLAPCRLDVTRL
jgi:hypothetical protein